MLAAACLAAVFAAAVPGGPVRHPGPLEKVLAAAAEKERPVLLEFVKASEKECGWMDRNVLGDAELAALLDGGFVVHRVTEGKGEAADLVHRFQVRDWPTFLFVDAEGEELERIAGAAGRTFFTEAVREISEGTHVAGLRRRMEKKPDDPKIRARLGRRLFLLGDPGADLHLRKALELDPGKGKEGVAEAAFLLEVKEALGASAGPLRKFLESHGESPRATEVHGSLVGVLSKREEWEPQIPSLEFLLDRAEDADARNNLSWALAKSGKDPARGLALVDEALKERPESPAFLDTRAECLSRLGRHDEALEVMGKAIALLGPSPARDVKNLYEKHRKEIEERKAAPK
jgi:tetratricopeptide (TPR) repeat protein